MPTKSNKQQETYADMKTRITEQPEIQSYPIGIYCYFGFDLILESCEVSVCQTQSVNKRYSICPNLPQKQRETYSLRHRFGGTSKVFLIKQENHSQKIVHLENVKILFFNILFYTKSK